MMSELFKKQTGKMLILILISVFIISLVVVDGIINKIEKTAQASIVANTIKHEKDMARLKAKHKKDLAKTKMKERSKRWFASIPIIGTAMLFGTGKDEYDEYDEWKKDNPGGTVEGYAKYKADLLIEEP